MSAGAALVSKGGGVAFGYLKAILDPSLRRKLDEEITNHVLSEIPRILRILEARIQEVQASGCTVQEANIIAHQVVEAQQRTLEEEKRRRLANVMVNGLCAPRWDRVRVRLLLRLTSELEEEHITLLQRYAMSPEERAAIAARDAHAPTMVETEAGQRVWRPSPEHVERWELTDALTRELVSRALVLEIPSAKVIRSFGGFEESPGAGEDVEIDWANEIAPLGLSLLEHLRDPEAPSRSGR